MGVNVDSGRLGQASEPGRDLDGGPGLAAPSGEDMPLPRAHQTESIGGKEDSANDAMPCRFVFTHHGHASGAVNLIVCEAARFTSAATRQKQELGDAGKVGR